ncbi:hypothetical protein [Sulfitobacter sp. SK012]|uniref:hypothetical protein n=1 Tax=Sulfitobacter sp. SK012 TaxID=1389005 RepID=UPI0020C826E9|nr:hypothetical protein [Sulfitobacter sp. SK012]
MILAFLNLDFLSVCGNLVGLFDCQVQDAIFKRGINPIFGRREVKRDLVTEAAKLALDKMIVGFGIFDFFDLSVTARRQ